MATKKKQATKRGAKARPCPECGREPHRMQKSERQYEIGCLAGHCRSRAGSEREAIEAWNAGDYLK